MVSIVRVYDDTQREMFLTWQLHANALRTRGISNSAGNHGGGECVGPEKDGKCDDGGHEVLSIEVVVLIVIQFFGSSKSLQNSSSSVLT